MQRHRLERWGLGGVLALLAWTQTLAQAPVDPPIPAPLPATEVVTPLASSQVPLDDIRRFVTVFNTVRDGYVDVVSDSQLISSAIRGVLLGLDPHSVYLEKTSAEELTENASGSYGGIGVEVLHLPDGWIRVIAPIDATPAARAGLRSGDVIIAVDGESLTTPDGRYRERLRGAPGTRAVLRVLREGHPEPLDITVTRDRIQIISVRGKMLEPGYGYIRLSAFQFDTAEHFHHSVEELRAQAGGVLRGLVIDLRSNPGGLLTAAVQIADDLLDSGAIVSTRGRMRVNDSEFVATPGDLLNGAPVVLIVDAGSASAAEVLAGALGDNRRARIVGSRTFGKGSVQTLLSLDNGDAIKLTIARYYTPSGRSIQAHGIDPDVLLHAEHNADTRHAGGLLLSEAVLPGHLRGEADSGMSGEGEADIDAVGRIRMGEVLDGEMPVAFALRELKTMAGEPVTTSDVAVSKD